MTRILFLIGPYCLSGLITAAMAGEIDGQVDELQADRNSPTSKT